MGTHRTREQEVTSLVCCDLYFAFFSLFSAYLHICVILLSQCILTVISFAVLCLRKTSYFSCLQSNQRSASVTLCLKLHAPHMLMALSDSQHWNIHLSSAINIFFSWGCIMHVDICMHTHKYISRYLVRGFRKQAVFKFHCIRYLASKISPLLTKKDIRFCT